MPLEDTERLIQHWEMSFKCGKIDERPDSFSYVALIKAWTKSNIKGFEEKCVQILDWMEEHEVVGMNRIAYNDVMDAMARSTRDDAGEMTEGLFKRLITRYGHT